MKNFKQIPGLALIDGSNIVNITRYGNFASFQIAMHKKYGNIFKAKLDKSTSPAVFLNSPQDIMLTLIMILFFSTAKKLYDIEETPENRIKNKLF